MRDCPEADWKTFRELREIALDRYCRDVLNDVQEVASERALTHHQRFLRVYDLLRDRDRALADAFDDVQASRLGL